MKLIISGGGGYVGTELIRQTLTLPQITNVIVLGRRPITLPQHANAGKIKQVLVESYEKYPDEVTKEFAGADACIWTVAITPTKSKQYDFETVRRVCQTSTLSALDAINKAGPAKPFRFIYMSGSSAERDQTAKPRMFADYCLMRGDTENKVIAFAKEHPDVEAQVVKPALITSYVDLARSAMTVVLKGLSYVTSLSQSVSVQEISAAMLSQAINGFEKETLENNDLVRIGQEALSKEG